MESPHSMRGPSPEASGTRCYACHRKIKAAEAWQAYLEDDDHAHVYVGPDCFKHVEAAGADGYNPPKGGPRLFATPELAERYEKNLAAYHGDIDGDFNAF